MVVKPEDMIGYDNDDEKSDIVVVDQIHSLQYSREANGNDAYELINEVNVSTPSTEQHVSMLNLIQWR